MSSRMRLLRWTRRSRFLQELSQTFSAATSRRRETPLGRWAHRVLGSGLIGLFLAVPLWADEKPKTPFWGFREPTKAAERSETEKPADEQATIRLFHSNAPWERVLEKLAADAGCTITLQDTPPGNYTRPDRQEHTLTEAIRILNRELEPIGFRILIKDRHLTVLDMHRSRSTYRRPVSPETSSARRQQSLSPPSETARTDRSKTLLQQRFETITRQLQRPQQEIAPASGVNEPAEILRSGHEEPAAEEPVQSAENATQVESVYVARNRTAVDLAQTVHRTFRTRSDLINAGPNDLPGLRVYRHAPQSEAANFFAADRSEANTWFTMEIDTEQNRLVITGLRQTSLGMTKLLARLDTRPLADEPTTKIIEGTESTVHVAQELQPELTRLLQARRRQQAQSGGAESMQLAFQNNPNQPPAGGGQPGQQDPAQDLNQGLSASASGLRGEVTIEAIPDLNLIIIRGNQEDLEKVQDIINQIEQLAVGSRPEIRIHFLRHVNSEALAELLNDVYERLGNLQNAGTDQADSSVDIVPLGTPNAILILAPTNTIDSVVDLAEELDQPGDARSEIEVFPLKTAVAQQVVDLLTGFYEERIGLGARPIASADIRTNTVIVRALPAELDEVRLLIRRMDRAPKSENQMRVVPLKQAAADELADFLNQTIQGILNPPVQQAGQGGFGGANQGAPELRDTRALVLEFLAMDGNAQRIIKSGALADVRITGDLRTNSLTVIAPEQTMELLLELIHVLDQPAAAIADIKVFTLQNADATTAVDLLNELFATDDEDQLGIAISGATDTSSTLVPLSFSFDARTNTVVAIGGLQALSIVEAILAVLDNSQIRERETTVYKLRNTLADNVATAINGFVTTYLGLIQVDPTRVSINEIIDQTYIVIPEPSTNNLLISASPRYFQQILDLIKQIDVVPQQVLISALLVEVDLQDTDEWGVELGFQDPILFERSNPGMNGGTLPGFLFNGQQLGTVPIRPEVVATQGLSNFALGRTNSDLAFGGLVLSASSDSVSVLLRALKARRNVRVLSAPKVHALDNQPALIQDGQQVPINTGVTITNNSTSPNIDQQQTGLILEVTPRITPEGQVVMAVSAQKSALSGSSVPIFVDAATGSVITSPIIDQTIASTQLMVNDGQTVVLGGIIVDSDTVNERKVPYLGDLPFVGHAFRFDSNTHTRAELLIFLTPHIIHNDADFELVKQVEAERLNFFEHEAEQIHGPLFSVPGPMYDQDGYQILPGGPMLQQVQPWCPPAESTPPADVTPTAPSTEKPVRPPQIPYE